MHIWLEKVSKIKDVPLTIKKEEYSKFLKKDNLVWLYEDELNELPKNHPIRRLATEK